MDERDLQALQQRLHELEAQNALFQAISGGGQGAAIFMADAETSRFLYVNDAVCRHFGAPRETVMGWHPKDYDPSATIAGMKEMSRILKEAGHLRFESVHVCAGGRHTPVEVELTYFEHAGQERVAGLFRDISERKQEEMRRIELEAEEARRVEGKRYQELFAGFEDSIFFVDVGLDGSFTVADINPAAERIFGLTRAKVRGKRKSELFPADLAARLEAHDRRCVETRRPVSYESAWESPQGARYFGVTLLPMFDGSGRVNRIGAVLRELTGQKQLEAGLVELSNMRQILLDSIANAGMQMLLIENGRIAYVSNRALAYRAGLTDAEIDAQPSMLDIVHPDDRAAVAENHRRRMMGEPVPNQYEVALLNRVDGERIEYEVAVSPVPGKGPGHAVVICWEVGERKRAERALLRMEGELRRREAEFRSLAENAPDPIFRYDRDCRRTYVNPAVERLTGQPAEALVGKTPAEFIPDSNVDAARAQRCIRQVLDTGEPCDLEVQLMAGDGREVVIHNRMVPEYGEDGEIVGVLCMGRDISDRIRMEREFRTLAENLPVAVIRYDAECRRRYLNPAAERMLHGKTDELLGQVPGGPTVPATPAMIAHYRGKMEEVLASGSAQEFDFVLDSMPVDRQEHYEVRFVPEFEGSQAIGVLAIWYDITERQRMTQQMRLLEYAVSQSSEGIHVVDTEGRIHFANAGFCRMLGYGADELLRLNLKEIDLAFDPERVAATIASLQVGDGRTFEAQHRRRDGQFIPVELHISPIDFGGQRLILAVAHEITQRKRMEEELRLKEQVLDQAHDGVYLIDENARFVYVNDEACRALGYSREELLGMGVGDIDYIKSDNEALAVRKKSLEEGAFSFETQHRRHDGSLLPVEIMASTLVYRGKHLGLALARDISERKRAEAALKESNLLLRNVLQGIPDPVWMKDAKGAFVVCNEGVARLFNMKVEDIIGKDDYDFFPPEQAEFYQNKDRAALEAGRVLVNEEWWTFGDNGEQALMETRKTPVRGADGTLLGVLGVARDITARNAAEKAFRETESKLKEAQRIAQVGSWELDLVSGDLAWSDEIFRIFEIDQQRFGASYEAFLEAIHPDDRDRVNEAYSASLENRTPYSIDHRLLFAEGRIKHVRECCETYYGEDGKPLRSVGTVQDITALKRMELDLRQRERDFRSLAENIPDNIARWDLAGRFLYSNPVHQKTLGKTFAEMAGRTHAELFPDGRFASFDETMAQVVARRQATLISRIQVPGEDGSMHFHDVRLSPEFDETGKVVSVLGVGRDMTDIYRMQDEIVARERELRALSDTTPGMMGSFYARPDGSLCMPYVSPGIETLFGLKPQDVADDASPLLACCHPDDAQRVADTIAESARNMTIWHEEYRIVHPELGLRWIESNTKPEPHPDGGVVWFGYLQDITDRKRMEAEIARERATLRTFFGAMPSLAWMKDTEGRYLACNPMFEQLYGQPEGAILGKTDFDFVDAELAAFFRQKDKEAEAAGKACVNEEWVTFVNDRRRALIETVKSPVFDAEGRVIGVIGVAHDITERKVLEKAYRDSEYMLKEAQRIAHVGSWDVDMVNDRLTWSDEVFRIWEIDKTKFRADFAAFLETVHPEDRERVVQAYNEAIQNHGFYEVEHRLLFPDGRVKYILEQGEPQYDEQGKPVRFIGSSLDITERREMEDSLRRSQEMLANAQSMAMLGSWDWDVAANRVEWSEVAYEIYTPDQRPVTPGFDDFNSALHPDDRERVLAAVSATFERDEPFDLEHRVVSAKRGVRTVHAQGKVFRDEDGKPVRMVGTVQDITERKQFEQALLDRGDLLHAVMESSPEVIVFALDANYRYLSFNGKHKQVMQAIWGKEIEVGMSMPDEVIGNDADRDIARRGFDRALSGESFVEESAYGDEALSREYWQTFWSPIRSSAGEVTGLTCFVLNISERRRMEESLRRSEQLMRTVIDATPDWIFIKDREHRYHLANKGYADALHMQSEDFIGKDDLDLGFPEALVKGDPENGIRGFWTDDRLVLESNETQVYPDDPATIDGEVHTFHTIKVPLRDADGKPWGVLAFCRDISERKQFEVLLSEREREFRTLAEGLPLPVIRYDRDKRRRYVNPATEKMLRSSAQALLGRIASEETPVSLSEAESFRSRLGETLEQGTWQDFEYRLDRLAGGRVEHFDVRIVPEYSADGSIKGGLAIFHDITAHKEAEASLQESLLKITKLNLHLEENGQRLEENARSLEEQATELEASQVQIKQTEAWYRSILQSAPDGMLVVDEFGTIMQVNVRLEAMFGYERGELPGTPIEVLLPDTLREAHVEKRNGFLAKRDLYRDAMLGKHLLGCRKDGSTFPVDVSLARLPELDGRRNAVCASVRDITEWRELETARETALAEAIRLAQLRSAFMAQMSHELRTPLNGILGYAQNLLGGGGGWARSSLPG